MGDELEMLSNNLAVLPLIPLSLLAVLLTHELGHYWVARTLGMKVSQVSIGFGRTIWERWDSHGTHWVIYACPFKAHVEAEGYDYAAGITLWKRIVVIMAGPLANLSLPLLLLGFFFIFFGYRIFFVE